MPSTFSDVLLIGGRPNQWVKYVNNDANAAHVYVSTAVSTFASTTTGSGVYTFTNPVPGIYTSYTIDGSLSSTQPAVGDARWAATGITSHVIPLTNGDDAALHSGSFLSTGPNTNTLPGDSGTTTPGGVSTGTVWDYGGAAYNAKAAGLKGDGATDDTAKLLTFITNVDGLGGGLIVLPPTSSFYLISNINYTATNPMQVWGYGATIKSSLSKTVNTPCLKLLGAWSLYGFTLDYTVAVVVDTDAVNRASGSHCMLLGGTGTGAYTTGVNVIDVKVKNGRNTCAYIQFASQVNVVGLQGKTGLGGGVLFHDVNDGWIQRCKIEDMGDDAIATLGDTGFLNTRIFVLGNSVFKTYGAGVDASGTVHLVIDHNLIDTTYTPGIYVWHDVADGFGNCDAVTIGDHNVIIRAGTYFGIGQFRTTVNGNPNGIRVALDAGFVKLGRPTIQSPQGSAIAIALTGTATIYRDAIYPRTVAGSILRTGGVSASTGVMTANRMTCVPILIGDLATAIALTLSITSPGSSGSVVRLGIYNDTGQTLPGTLLLDAGTVVGTSAVDVSIVISQLLQPGLYWLAASSQGAPVTPPTVNIASGQHPLLQGQTHTGSNINAWYQDSVSAGLPSTFAVSGNVGAGVLVGLGF